MAPRRAITRPSLASRVTVGGAIGRSERDSGAVTASHPSSDRTSIKEASATRRGLSSRRHNGRRAAGGAVMPGAGGLPIGGGGSSA